MSTWKPIDQEWLEALVAQGLTGAEIAERLGRTRNSVLGRAHRTGVILPLDDRKARKQADAAAAAARTPQFRSAAAQRLRGVWNDPEKRAARVAAMTAGQRARFSAAKAAQ